MRWTLSGRLLRNVVLAAVLVTLAVWGFLLLRPQPSTEWHVETGFRWRELPRIKGRGAGFTLLPETKTGISFTNRLQKKYIKQNRVLLNGSGVALGDADGDGLVDIYFSRLDGPNEFYKNLGGWKFQEIAKEAGVACEKQFSTGATFADIDGDGDLDLLVTAIGGSQTAFLNDGTGKFTDVTAAAGIPTHTGATSMALADVDGDGDLDLYITNYKKIRAQDIYTPIELSFDNVVRKVGDEYQIAPKYREHYTLEFRGKYLLRLETGEPDFLLLNDGKGHFSLASFSDGTFLDEQGRPVPEPKDWGLMVRFVDIDDDGDPDLYVCNDFESPDRIWINDGSGHFRAIPRLAIRKTSHSSMAVDFSDIDRDGDLDFFVADMLSRYHQRRKMQMGSMVPASSSPGGLDNRPQYPRNTFFLNRGDNTFAEIASFSGLEASEWSWSVLFLDVDLDGYEDLLVSTGTYFDFTDSDTDEKIRDLALLGFSDYQRIIFMYPRLSLPNVAFRNRGDLTFEDVSETWGFGPMDDMSHGMALGDLDNDGDLDVVINRLDAPAAVYRNEGRAPRLAVRLRGLPPNTQGIGAKIMVLGGPVPQSKEVVSGGAYLSGSDPLSVFAAGDARSELTIQVRWRSGKRSVVSGARGNRIYEIFEAQAEAVDGQPSDDPAAGAGRPYFEDVSQRLAHVHHEDVYDDFFRQPLLPNRLSQLGPGVAWHDIDADGADDLIIASGKGGKLSVFLNQKGRGFTPLLEPLLNRKAEHDQTAVLALPGRGGLTSLLVANSNFEDEGRGESFVSVYDFRPGGATLRQKIEVGSSSVGPLAMSDYDGDGDLDLFVGGRTIPGRYPEPASSRLYRNEGGRFVLDEVNSAVFRQVGMVTGAVFSDLDGDGDGDLVLSLEWGPVRVYRNDAGRYVEVTKSLGLSGYTGWWNGVTTGDLDEDGRLDIIATNWGLNSKYHYDREHPLRIYYADFDHNGTLDIIEAHYDPLMRKIVPERGLSSVSKAIPYVRIRTSSYRKYGGASLQTIIGPQVERAAEVTANTLAHMVFFNRGDHFEAVELPREAQFAPGFYVGVSDFDGDGHDDVFISQNFFGSQSETPRIDAGRGLWLKGDGTGNLKAIPGQQSGVTVYGEQRGAALGDFDQDGRVDLVVSQNAAATRLFHNVRGKPGLRVRLLGSPQNQAGVGATIRLKFGERYGPAREIHAGSGYWSQDSFVPVLGTPVDPTEIWVRWPDGKVTTAPVPRGAREVTVRRDSSPSAAL